MTKLTKGKIVLDVFDEIKTAEKKHGEFPPDKHRCLSIITEELGETAQALLKSEYEGGKEITEYKEAVQLTAMGFRFLFRFYSKE